MVGQEKIATGWGRYDARSRERQKSGAPPLGGPLIPGQGQAAGGRALPVARGVFPMVPCGGRGLLGAVSGAGVVRRSI